MGIELLNFIFDCEKAFGIKIPRESIGAVQTVGEFSDAIAHQIPAMTREAVWEKVRKIAADMMVLPPAEMPREFPLSEFH